jgi:hypothetical protein
VKLILQDPNVNLPSAVLAPAVKDRQAQEAKAHGGQKVIFRTVAAFSDPSPTVGIPLSGNVRLAKASLPATEKYNDEPSIRMLVQAFDSDAQNNPIQAAVEKDLHRGYVANYVEDADYLVPETGNTMIDVWPSFKFLTGMMILDVDGGAKLTRDLTTPARVMVMGPAGDLYIHNEADDKSVVEFHRLMFEKPDKRKTGPGGMGPEGPGPASPRPRRTASRG